VNNHQHSDKKEDGNSFKNPAVEDLSARSAGLQTERGSDAAMSLLSAQEFKLATPYNSRTEENISSGGMIKAGGIASESSNSLLSVKAQNTSIDRKAMPPYLDRGTLDVHTRAIAGGHGMRDRDQTRQMLSKSKDCDDISNLSCENGSATSSYSLLSDESITYPTLPTSHPLMRIKDRTLSFILLKFQDWTNDQYGNEEYSVPEPVAQNNTARPPRRSGSNREIMRGNDDTNNMTSQGPQVARAERKPKDSQYSFACPFWAKDNRRHSICVKYVLTRIRDVKQHLLRRHQMPIYCPVCYDTFTDEVTRDAHIRNRACGHVPGEEPEGITSTQRYLLSKKVPSNIPEHEQWYRVFEILFPNHRPWPASPYIQCGLQQNVQAYHDFLSTQGLGILRGFIRNQGLELVSPANGDSELLAFQDQILREGLQAVLDQYLSRGGPSTPARATPAMTSLPTAPNTSTFSEISNDAAMSWASPVFDQPGTAQLMTDQGFHMNLDPAYSLQNLAPGPSSASDIQQHQYAQWDAGQDGDQMDDFLRY
jgi:hypothetical protein